VIRIRRAIVVVVAAAAVVGAVEAVPGSAQPSARSAADARTAAVEPQQLEARLLRTYDAFDANQGVGVDRSHFYAVDNTSITTHSRETGAPLLQFAGAGEGGALIHMDSGAVHSGRLYAAHSNYNESPMQSSVEVFDARTMEHADSHSFGIDRGSLTWIDRHDGSWWAAFANYDRIFDGEVYGETDNTQVVKLDDRFQVIAGYTIPKEILDRFRPMSNSGGSWGPDGRLWLTGHDLGEAYVMEPPLAGSELRWIATVRLPGVEGQGIAWDLSGPRPTLWAIKRSTKQVLQFEVPYRDIAEPAPEDWKINGPGHFQP
jgi:hypothetical protein